jgi:hypothetical protein
VNDQGHEAHGLGAFLRKDWPYIAMLMLALFGVAVASVSIESLAPYWEIMVPLFAAVCIYARLQDHEHKANVRRLFFTEALHWGATFAAMQLLYARDVYDMMNANGVALTMMIILALGTLTAGAQIGAWRIAVVGALIGLAVPFVAFLQRATLLVTLISLALVGVGGFYLAHRRAHKPAQVV